MLCYPSAPTAVRPVPAMPAQSSLHRNRHIRDVNEHAACLNDWGQRYDQLSSGAFDGEFEEFRFDTAHLFRERMNQAVYESGTPQVGAHSVAVMTGGDGEGWFNGHAVSNGALLFVQGGERFDFRTPRRHEVLAATLGSGMLGDYARQVEHRELEENGHPVVSSARADAYRAFLDTLFAALRATPRMLDSAPMRRAMEQALAGAMLEALGQTGIRHAHPSARVRQHIVEEARDLIQANIDAPVSVADLCIHLGISRRTLQYSFQEVLDLTPVKFLRAMRLNSVRRALRQARASQETV
ncbi:MAG: helix-turn-helix domain-containing protein, partial [Azoarcus sp.]|nr:helix-turn-helix domain-containing protein [Azoarcus sp.]